MLLRGAGDLELHSPLSLNCVGSWAGSTLEETDTMPITALTGGAGSLVLLNRRTIHGSAPNRSDRSRPLLLIVSPCVCLAYTLEFTSSVDTNDANTGECGDRSRVADP